MLIAIQRQVPQSPTVRKTGEAQLAQFNGNSADVLLISQINQVTKHAEISQIYYILTQTQYINHAAAVLVVIQRPVPQIQMVLKTVKVPPAPLIAFRQWTSHIPLLRRKLMERIPERNGDHFVDVPVPQTSEDVAEVVKAVKKSQSGAYFWEDL